MRIFWRFLAALVLVAAILGIGAYAYNLGMTQGLAQKVTLPAGLPVQGPFMHYGYPFVGYGFGFLGCLIPLFLLFLVFGILRAMLWHGPMGWGHMMHRRRWDWRDENGKGVPPFFEEWHRRAHSVPDWDKAPEEKQK
ncbi:MAG TPA: hypothetical protein VF326_06340 [Anaerolineaceae bacterium]